MSNDRTNNIRMMAILAAMIALGIFMLKTMPIGIRLVAWAVTTIPSTHIVGLTLTLVSSATLVIVYGLIADALVRMGRRYWKLYRKG